MRWRRKKAQPEASAPASALAELADENGVIRLGGTGGGPGQPGQPGKRARLEVGPDGRARLTIDETGGGRGGSA